MLDATDVRALGHAVVRHHADTVFHLAAILSAVGERDPRLAWHVNMASLEAVLEVAREQRCGVFTPSSIGVFGPGTPKDPTPQDTLMRPATMYGITKVAGELLCDYYHHRYGVDTRGVRYPGLISYGAPPGGGTTAPKDITDGVSGTVMLVESPATGMSWMEPKDVTLQNLKMRINVKDGIGNLHERGAQVATADGQIHFLRQNAPTEFLRAMFTRSGGEVVPWAELEE